MTTGIDQALLQSLLTDLSGYEVLLNPVQPLTMVDPTKKVQIFFDAGNISALGWDDFIPEFDDDLDKNIITQHGNRLFTMSVRVESYVPTLHAHDILERIRTKLFRPSSLARLRASNMTACGSSGTVDLPTSYDNRVISVSTMDVQMSLFVVDTDDSDIGEWIETVVPEWEDPS